MGHVVPPSLHTLLLSHLMSRPHGYDRPHPWHMVSQVLMAEYEWLKHLVLAPAKALKELRSFLLNLKCPWKDWAPLWATAEQCAKALILHSLRPRSQSSRSCCHCTRTSIPVRSIGTPWRGNQLSMSQANVLRHSTPSLRMLSKIYTGNTKFIAERMGHCPA